MKRAGIAMLFTISLLAQAQSRQRFEGMVTLPSVAPARASVEGLVVSEATGQPLAGATVTLTRHFDSFLALISDTVIPNVPPATTDATGRFSFPAIDPGDYDIAVRMSGHMLRKAAISPAPGQRVAGFNVRLISSARIGGSIRSSSGEPLAGIPLQLFQPDLKNVQSVAQATSAGDGSYQLDGFLPGNYVLVAGSPGDVTREPPSTFAAAIAVASPDPLELNFAMKTTRYAVRGKVTMRDTGLPPGEAGIAVSTRGLPGKNRVALGGMNVQYNAQTGAFEIPNLLPGIYRILRGCGSADILVSTNDVIGVELPDGNCN
jgi:hypothetical protein